MRAPPSSSSRHERYLILGTLGGFLILVGALSLKNNYVEGGEDTPLPPSSTLRGPSTGGAASTSMSTFGNVPVTMENNEVAAHPCSMEDCDELDNTSGSHWSEEALWSDPREQPLGSGELLSSSQDVLDTNELLNEEATNEASFSVHNEAPQSAEDQDNTEATSASSEDDSRIGDESPSSSTSSFSSKESLDQLEIEQENEEALVARMEDEHIDGP